MKVQTNVIYDYLQKSQSKINIFQGGTRSGKTYNILMWLIFGYAMRHTGKTITIFRATYPALRATVMRDFFDILERFELYLDKDHNKSNSEYKLNGNLFEFVSIDQSSRLKGRKRNIAFLNEANEASYESYNQILFRTEEQVILDYNPSDEYSWIYSKVKTRDDAFFCITTYRDNRFLSKEIVKEIERLRDTDQDYWRVYGLGQVGRNRATIFNYLEVDKVPEEAEFIAGGLDWGFVNDPSVLVFIYLLEDKLYIDEQFYQYGMTNRDIHNKFVELGFTRQTEIFADSSEPKSVDELHRFGWNVKSAQKGRDSINMGIDLLKRHKLHITSKSINTLKEFKNYKWQEDKNGTLLNVPIQKNDHSIDSTRYAVIKKLTRPRVARYAIR